MSNINKGTATIFHQQGKPYTSISNAVVDSINNPDALAIWTFLQTKDNGWKVLGNYLRDKFGLGRKRYSDAMTHLEQMGLVQYDTQRNELGQLIGRRIIVNYEPVLTEVSENPHLGEPTPRPTHGSVNLQQPIKELLPMKDNNQCAASEKNSNQHEQTFNQFWSEYPKKVGKKPALTAWLRTKPNAELVATIMAALRKQKASDQWAKDDGKFVPHASTWLNGERWNDELDTNSDGGQYSNEFGHYI